MNLIADRIFIASFVVLHANVDAKENVKNILEE